MAAASHIFGRRVLRRLRGLAFAAVLASIAAAAAGCNQGLGAFQTGVGNTPNRAPGTSFRVLGQRGMMFSAVVSDAQSSWLVQGAIPLSIVIVNNTTPVRMIATKQSGGDGILSLQLTVGFTVLQVSSTNAPYGTATLQSGVDRPGFAPPPPLASPDVRFFVKGPLTERFSGLIEDQQLAFAISDRAPALFLFDSPTGKVDATFNQIQNLGPFDVDLIRDGGVVAHVVGGPTVTIREP